MSDKKIEKKPLVPRLRFPEFQDSGEWEIKRLGEISKIITEKAGKKKLMLLSVTAGVGLISQIEKFGREIAGSQYKNYFMIKTNDFAYNKSATKEYPQGFIALYTGKDDAAVPNSIFTCFRVNTQNTVPQYLNFLFENNLHGTWLRHFITVGARAHGSLNIDNADLLKTPVPLPRGKLARIEQQKIAECVSSLDKLITSECKNLNTLKTCKKGLMQHLFPREGETIPRIRFSKIQGQISWRKMKLGDIGTFAGGGTPDRSIANFWIGQNPWISSSDLSEDSILHISATRYISDEAIKKSSTKVIPANSILIVSRVGVGKVAVSSIPICTSQDFTNITPRDEDHVFIAYYLCSIKDTLLSFNQGMGIRGFKKDDMTSIEVSIPSLPEQQKIARCLSSLDELIAAQARKIELLKLQKKGLMQQLFPEMDEVTA